MKKSAIHLIFLILAAVSPTHAIAQDTPSPATQAKKEVATTAIKLQIVFTEYEGDKKVKSLPYTIYHNSVHAETLQLDSTKLRIGSRVPVAVGTNQFQYQDIGTNLDARAVRHDDGRFLVQLSLERSWIEGETSIPMSNSGQQVVPAGMFKEPIVRNMRCDLNLSLREGQTSEVTAATDPISGRVVRAEVTLTVVK
jgi:hypothetical protein